MAMRERPHLIALTGDFAADEARDFGRVISALGELKAPFGVYAVPGNHDYEVGIDTWHRQMGDHPVIRDLTNQAVMLDVDGARLCVAGVDDYLRGSPTLEALPPPEERDFTLLLAHDPDQGEYSRRSYDRVDLIVSGHTHAGQVRFPIIGAVENPVERPDLYEEGLRRRPWTQVYTSRGVGTVRIPVRLLTRPEVAVLRLTGAPRPPRNI
jgi:predicted MPP superfamily phosphohydrolase